MSNRIITSGGLHVGWVASLLETRIDGPEQSRRT